MKRTGLTNLKADMRQQGAQVAILVTRVMPRDMTMLRRKKWNMDL